MIGVNPTVDCVVIREGVALQEATTDLKALLAKTLLVPERNWHYPDENKQIALAMLGGRQQEILLHCQQTTDKSAIFLAFDEDQTVILARQTGLTISELLSPYVLVLEQIKGAYLVGIGFELSIPSRDDNESLKDIGIAIAWIRERENEGWMRKELQPVIGHYL